MSANKHSYGLKTVDAKNHYFCKNILTINQELPAETERTYGIVEDGQDNLILPVYRNDSESLRVEFSECEKVGDLRLDLPEGMKKENLVKVKFTITEEDKLVIEYSCNGKVGIKQFPL